MTRLFLIIAALVAFAAPLPGADADTDWQAIVALDAGPRQRGAKPAQLPSITFEHLRNQERALRSFLAAHSTDARAFEARLRLARLLSLRAELQAQAAPAEINKLLVELEKTATPAQLVEIEFTKISDAMRRLRQPSAAQREELLAMARRFQAAHPNDARVPALLAEVATLFDLQPQTKETLLREAQPLARDDELKARIADDLRRCGLVGKVVPFQFKAAGTAGIDLRNYRGKMVLLIFFAGWSPPAVDALDALQRAALELPKGRIQLIGVSLDTKPDRLVTLIREKKITWPIACDGRGWESPLVRALGINAVPTVWLIDQEGRLRSLNALEGTVAQVRALLREQG